MLNTTAECKVRRNVLWIIVQTEVQEYVAKMTEGQGCLQNIKEVGLEVKESTANINL